MTNISIKLNALTHQSNHVRRLQVTRLKPHSLLWSSIICQFIPPSIITMKTKIQYHLFIKSLLSKAILNKSVIRHACECKSASYNCCNACCGNHHRMEQNFEILLAHATTKVVHKAVQLAQSKYT